MRGNKREGLSMKIKRILQVHRRKVDWKVRRKTGIQTDRIISNEDGEEVENVNDEEGNAEMSARTSSAFVLNKKKERIVPFNKFFFFAHFVCPQLLPRVLGYTNAGWN